MAGKKFFPITDVAQTLGRQAESMAPAMAEQGERALAGSLSNIQKTATEEELKHITASRALEEQLQNYPEFANKPTSEHQEQYQRNYNEEPIIPRESITLEEAKQIQQMRDIASQTPENVKKQQLEARQSYREPVEEEKVDPYANTRPIPVETNSDINIDLLSKPAPARKKYIEGGKESKLQKGPVVEEGARDLTQALEQLRAEKQATSATISTKPQQLTPEQQRLRDSLLEARGRAGVAGLAGAASLGAGEQDRQHEMAMGALGEALSKGKELATYAKEHAGEIEPYGYIKTIQELPRTILGEALPTKKQQEALYKTKGMEREPGLSKDVGMLNIAENLLFGQAAKAAAKVSGPLAESIVSEAPKAAELIAESFPGVVKAGKALVADEEGALRLIQGGKDKNILDLTSDKAKSLIKAAESLSSSEAEANAKLEMMIKEHGYDGYINPASETPEHIKMLTPLSRIEEAEIKEAHQYAESLGIKKEADIKPTKSFDEFNALVKNDPRYKQTKKLEQADKVEIGTLDDVYDNLLKEYQKKFTVLDETGKPFPEYEQTVESSSKPTKSGKEIKQIILNDPRYLKAIELEKESQITGDAVNDVYRKLFDEYEQKYNIPFELPTKNVTPIKGKFKEIQKISHLEHDKPEIKKLYQTLEDEDLVYGDPTDFQDSYLAKNEKGEPAGFLGLDDNQRTKSIRVDPGHRRQGIASKLHKEALNEHGVIRSEHRPMELTDGTSMWESFERQYPGAVRQARDPETLKPLDYRVWQKNTDLNARKAEEAIEKQIDELREINNSSRIIKDIEKNPEWQELQARAEETGLFRDRQAAADFRENLYRELYGKTPKQKEIEKQIDALIKQHKELTKKSKHVMYATGGAVLSASPDNHEQKDVMFYRGGQVQHFVDGGVAQPMPQEQTDPNTGLPIGMEPPKWEDAQSLEESYGGLSGQALAAGQGLGKGLLGPIFTGAERLAGVTPETIKGLEEANPITSGIFNVAGFLAPMGAVKAGGALAKLGVEGVAAALPSAAKYTQLGLLEAVGSKIAPFAGESLGARLGNAGARNFIEGALFGAGDEATKMILEDPHQSTETAISNIMLSGLIASTMGIGVEAGVSTIEHATESKLGKFVADFRARIAEHQETPNPVDAMTKELDEYYNHLKSIETAGLKDKDIAKAMPQMHSGMTEQTNKIVDTLQAGVDKLGSDPHARLLQDLTDELKASIEGAEKPHDVFKAVDNAKRQLQEWGQYNKEMVSLAERPFRNLSKSLGRDLRIALEDSSVWGKAGERQAAINKSISDFLPARQDFERRFTSWLAGERVIDPGKIATYINQLGKPSAELKQEMIRNFLDSAEVYKTEINKTHANLGLESPVMETPLNVTKNTLKERTKGAAVADFLINKALTDSGATALAAGTGVGVGSMLGLGHTLSAMLGVGVLSPLYKTILPVLAKSVMEREVSPAGARAAAAYIDAAAKGRALIANGVKNMFRPNMPVLPQYAMPSQVDRKKLERNLDHVKNNPDKLINNDQKLMHYMPGSGSAVIETIGHATEYLDSLRPNVDPKAPLDPKPVASAVQKSEYHNALDIANQPAFILVKIKEGTVTAKDIQHLNALYPSLANSMRNQVANEIINQVSKNKPIPYKTRVGISMFLGQPMDSTMMATTMQNAQMPMSAKSGGQQPMPMGQPAKGRPSSPALQKMSGLYQTSAQARLQHKNKQ